MADLSFQHGDAEWTRQRDLCRTNLFYLASMVLGFADSFPLEKATHGLYCRFLERRTGIPDIDDAPIQLCATPRGTGKTVLGSIAQAIQLALVDPNVSVLLAFEKADNAMEKLASIKNQFETNDLLKALFPEIIPTDFKQTTWSASKAILTRTTTRPEPTFYTTGVGGATTGTHPDFIIIDDPISDDAMESSRAGNWEVMRRVNRWFDAQKLLLNQSAKPFPWIRVNGTRWWMDDTYEHIEKTYSYGEPQRHYRLSLRTEDGRTVSRDVYRAGDVAVYRAAAIEDGIVIYPKIWPLDALVKQQQTNAVLFSCNMMNDPIAAEIRTFQDEWLRYYVSEQQGSFGYKTADGMRWVLRDDLLKLCVVDPAFTAGGEGDRSAIVVVGTDMDTGKHLVLEAIAERKEPKDVIDDTLNVCQRLKVRRLYVEAVAQQAGFIQFLQSEALRRGIPLGIETVKPGGKNKDVRIETLSPYFRSGGVLIHPHHIDLIREYQHYRPGARYRDLLDALAYAAEVWPNPTVGPSRSTAQTGDARARAEVNGYLARRGLAPQSPPNIASIDGDW